MFAAQSFEETCVGAKIRDCGNDQKVTIVRRDLLLTASRRRNSCACDDHDLLLIAQSIYQFLELGILLLMMRFIVAVVESPEVQVIRLLQFLHLCSRLLPFCGGGAFVVARTGGFRGTSCGHPRNWHYNL